MVCDGGLGRAHCSVHLSCGTKRCPPRMSGMTPNPLTCMHHHALPLSFWLEVDSSVEAALGMNPLHMLHNGTCWILLIMGKLRNTRRGATLWVQVALAHPSPMCLRWLVLALCTHWTCTCIHTHWCCTGLAVLRQGEMKARVYLTPVFGHRGSHN